MATKFQLRSFVFLMSAIISTPGLKFQTCGPKSPPNYFCNKNQFQRNCNTFAILRSNSLYSSISNLTYYLGISTSALAQANAVKANAVFSIGQPILIPINCNCDNGISFEAVLRRTAVNGESFDQIADSFQGLTTCDSIWGKNPKISPWNLRGKIGISVPLECACPDLKKQPLFLLSYPVKEGDTLSELAVEFNVSAQSIVSANNRHSKTRFNVSNGLIPFSTLLIPLKSKPLIKFVPQYQPQTPKSPQQNHPNPNPNPSSSKPDEEATATVQTNKGNSHKRKKNHKKLILLVVVIFVIGLLVIASFVATCFFILKHRKRQDSIKSGNWDQLKGLSLNVAKLDNQIENDDDNNNNYSFEELQLATEDFSSTNLIEGSVYHGRLNGKDVAIKRIPSDFVSRIDFRLFSGKIVSHHPNIVRFLGTCSIDGPDSFVVLEYAENGSLKDWIHSGLAIKSQFIASTNCFLTWKQRIKICLDVATALYYMHNTSNYIHRNIRSRNIFLDRDFNAKVGNFAMPYHEDQESGDNNRGYLAPEYVSRGVVSTSIDVFAYGVVLLEILSGKSGLNRDSVKSLCDEIKHVLELGGLREWIDSALGEDYSFDGALVMAKLGRSCVEEDPFLRPSAGEIVEKLLRLVEESTVEDEFSFSVVTQ